MPLHRIRVLKSAPFIRLWVQRRILTCLLMVTMSGHGGLGAQPGQLIEVWREAAQAQFADALRRVTGRAKQPEASAEARYARALLLLNTPPTTEARLTEASLLLERVTLERETEPEVAAAAAYFRARIEAVHRLQPDLALAKRLYEEAWHQHRWTSWAERSALKWLTLHLVSVDTSAPAAERLAEGERLGAEFRIDDVRKNYHLLMAESWGRLGEDRVPILEHLLAADAIGIAYSQTRADVFCAIGSNAAQLGRHTVALKYYERYLTEFTRDARRDTVLREVQRLKASRS